MKKLLISSLITLFSLNGLAQCFTQISAGAYHTLAIKSDGTLWGWGSNGYGQLGDGTRQQKIVPTQIGKETTWKKVSCGEYHSLAIKTNANPKLDGTLWAWGSNEYGQIGNNEVNPFLDTIADQLLPVQIGGSANNWVDISAGGLHSLAIKGNGTLWAWGDANAGQLGNGDKIDKLIPTQIGIETDWLSVSAGYLHSIGLKSDNSIRAWGQNIYGQLGDDTRINKFTPTVVVLGNDIKKIDASETHTLAIKTDGSLWAWGSNGYGQLGNMSYNSQFKPIQIGEDYNWVEISSTGTFSVGLKETGTLWVWGDNNKGQLGIDNTFGKILPFQVGAATNWQSISAGSEFVIARNVSSRFFNNLSAWGDNSYGQLGDGTTIRKFIPTQMVSCNVLVQSLDNENHEENKLTLTPNPASDFINISNTNNSKIDKYSIVDALGQVIKEEKYDKPEINIQQLKSGLYFILVESECETHKSKFIKP